MTRKFLSDDEEPDEEIRKLYETSEVFRKYYDFIMVDLGHIDKQLKRGKISELEAKRQMLHQAMRLISEFTKKEEEAYEDIEKVLQRIPALARDPDFMKKHEKRKRAIDIRKEELAQWEEDLRRAKMYDSESYQLI
jgi:hypothetical protein